VYVCLSLSVTFVTNDCWSCHFQAPWCSDDTEDVGYKIVEDELVVGEGEMDQEAEDFLRKVS
jgi:hypothetical protein